MPEMPLMAVLPLSRAVPDVKAIRDVPTPISDRRTPVAVPTAIKRFVENALPAATSQSRNLLDNVKKLRINNPSIKQDSEARGVKRRPAKCRQTRQCSAAAWIKHPLRQRNVYNCRHTSHQLKKEVARALKGRQRAHNQHEPGDTDGRAVPPVLDTSGPGRRAARGGLHPDADPGAG